MRAVEMLINDQGGGVINCESGEVCPTWRRETKHHEPLILESEMETEIQDTTGPSNTNDGTMIAVMYDGSDTHPSLTCRNAGGGQRMPDKENFNGIIEMKTIQPVCGPMEAKDGRGVHSQMAGEGKLIPVMEGETYSIDQGGGKSSCNAYKEVAPTTTTHQGEPVVNTKIKEIINGNAEKARPGEVLLLLRKTIGENSLREWITGEYARLHPTEVLHEEVHGGGVRREADADEGRPHEQIPYTETDTARAVCDMWEAERKRHSPQGPQPAEQRFGQSDSPVQELSLEATPQKGSVQNLWETSDGSQLVQHALAALQEMGRPADGAGKPVHEAGDKSGVVSETPQYHYAVRRITPTEGCRLQGFSDGWTRPCFRAEDITDALVDRFVAIHQNWSAINGKPNAKPKSRKWVRNWLEKISSSDCPDGPRYKAIGNSMSVNVMSWIGQRIQQAENETKGTTK